MLTMLISFDEWKCLSTVKLLNFPAYWSCCFYGLIDRFVRPSTNNTNPNRRLRGKPGSWPDRPREDVPKRSFVWGLTLSVRYSLQTECGGLAWGDCIFDGNRAVFSAKWMHFFQNVFTGAYARYGTVFVVFICQRDKSTLRWYLFVTVYIRYG